MKYTHQKIIHRAQVVQWDRTNITTMRALDHDLMVRHSAGIFTLSIGAWRVKGENGGLKAKNKHLFSLKYESIK
jgi:hypothetical protein